MTEKPRIRHRFAVPPEAIRGGQVRFPSTIARQMRRVLRLSPGDHVIAFDGQGSEFTVALISVRDDLAVGSIEAEHAAATEPKLQVTLCQALLPREKFEIVLQKGTEVGVTTFVPIETDRSLVKASAVDAARLERWRRIINEAAEQSGRAGIPTLAAPASLTAALAGLAGAPALLAWERETSLSVRQALVPLELQLQSSRLTLFTGPEGGFTQAEAVAARAAGAITISLGPRILRAETAGPILAALALYQSGDLEPAR